MTYEYSDYEDFYGECMDDHYSDYEVYGDDDSNDCDDDCGLYDSYHDDDSEDFHADEAIGYVDYFEDGPYLD